MLPKLHFEVVNRRVLLVMSIVYYFGDQNRAIPWASASNNLICNSNIGARTECHQRTEFRLKFGISIKTEFRLKFDFIFVDLVDHKFQTLYNLKYLKLYIKD